MNVFICGECNKPTELLTAVEEMDYEYWGSPGVHEMTVEITECCHSEDFKELDDQHCPECWAYIEHEDHCACGWEAGE